jgi:CRISP-associated protein Cas1
MKKLLNTLYITTQGTYLHRDGETVTAKKNNDVLLRVPIHTLEGIVCFGRVLVSPPAMELCAEHGVLISFCSEHGKFWARMQGPVRGNVLLRRQQYRMADLTGQSLPDSMRWRGESLKTPQDHSAQ